MTVSLHNVITVDWLVPQLNLLQTQETEQEQLCIDTPLQNTKTITN